MCELDLSGSAQGPEVDLFFGLIHDGHEPLGFMKDGTFLDNISDY